MENAHIEAEYQKWLANAGRDDSVMRDLREMAENEAEKLDCFYQNLSFGTGGLRGKMGAGTNRMNTFTVGKCTQGLADYLKKTKQSASAVIAYDTRNNSRLFAETAAGILAANGISVSLFDTVHPTPMLSFTVRELGADCGIVITASHNPKEYNGYKVYGDDGGQLTDHMANAVLECMNACDIFGGIRFQSVEDALASGKLHIIGADIDSIYFEKVKALVSRTGLIKEHAKDLKIIYTPIHGSGNIPVRRVLSELGFSDITVVPEQEKPDGNFPTAPYPNPEDPKVFAIAMEMAKQSTPDLIFGTDPDCDRIGVLAKDEKGKFVVLTGNQTGILLTDYLIHTLKEQGKLPQNAAVINTIVTSDLVNVICEKEGVACFDVLTGFKYIAELIGQWEQDGSHSFIFGFEESYGYLKGDFVRDKDAVIASALIAEMALYYKQVKDMTLYQALQDVYARYGYAKEELVNAAMKGKDGQEKMGRIMSDLRVKYAEIFAGHPLFAVEDYKASTRVLPKTGEEQAILLPKSNVLKFIFEDGSWLVLRPSGTEPKIKLYLYAISPDAAKTEGRIAVLKEFVDRILPE
ncbi:MAG: phospho-sugar mutase [Oscillospiraceae bacterium]|jgi:phosphoglucomutase|nr:phospho-sugar mutase [Oscillospiraceae bacterium]